MELIFLDIVRIYNFVELSFSFKVIFLLYFYNLYIKYYIMYRERLLC